MVCMSHTWHEKEKPGGIIMDFALTRGFRIAAEIIIILSVISMALECIVLSLGLSTMADLSHYMVSTAFSAFVGGVMWWYFGLRHNASVIKALKYWRDEFPPVDSVGLFLGVTFVIIFVLVSLSQLVRWVLQTHAGLESWWIQNMVIALAASAMFLLAIVADAVRRRMIDGRD